MSFNGIRFTNYPLPNGTVVHRARASDKCCAFHRWVDVKHQIGDRDVIIRAEAGPVMTKQNGKVQKCTNGFPLLETATAAGKLPTRALIPLGRSTNTIRTAT